MPLISNNRNVIVAAYGSLAIAKNKTAIILSPTEMNVTTFFALFIFEIDRQYFHDSGNRQADKQRPIDPDYESIAIYIP